MNKKQAFIYMLGIMVAGYLIGYILGVSKVIIFQSIDDGKYALVNVCDVDSEYIDGDNNCRNFDKTKVTLKEATGIVGTRWASWGSAFGFLAGLGILDWLEKRRIKIKNYE